MEMKNVFKVDQTKHALEMIVQIGTMEEVITLIITSTAPYTIHEEEEEEEDGDTDLGTGGKDGVGGENGDHIKK